jgi:hypothetical protein
VGRVGTGRGAWIVNGDRATAMPSAGWQPFGRDPSAKH